MLFSSAEESEPELLSESDLEPESDEREFLRFLELPEESDSSLLDESYKRSSTGGREREGPALPSGRGGSWKQTSSEPLLDACRCCCCC